MRKAIDDTFAEWFGKTFLDVVNYMKNYAFQFMATFVYFGLATMAMFFPYVYLEFLSGKNLTTTYPYEDSDFFYNFVVE